MYANGHYLQPATGTNGGQDYFFFDIQVNPNRYGIQLNTYMLPTAANLADSTSQYYGCSYPNAAAAHPITSTRKSVSIHPRQTQLNLQASFTRLSVIPKTLFLHKILTTRMSFQPIKTL
jgi:hypothetical protein